MVIILVVVGVLGLCCVIGTVAAIAIPNFVKFNSRAKQSEAKVNLKSIFVAEKAFFADQDRYSESIAEIGWSPERGNRYLYALSADGDLLTPGGTATKDTTGVLADSAKHVELNNDDLEKGVPPELWKEVGLSGTCPDDCGITAVAASNIDHDSVIDVWSVSTKDRQIDGVPVPAGQPHHHIDDTKD